MANIVYEIQEETAKYNSELESSTTKLHETKLKKLSNYLLSPKISSAETSRASHSLANVSSVGSLPLWI